MTLTPVHLQRELQPRAGSPQLHIQPQRTAAATPSPEQAAAERPLLHQLRRPLPLERQRLFAVVGGDIPGIPELALIAPTAPLQGLQQLRQTIGTPELHHPGGRQLGAHQAIAEQPAGARRTITDLRELAKLHRLQDRLRRCGWRRIRAFEGKPGDATDYRQLDPGATARSRLTRQRPGGVRCHRQPPAAARQPQGERATGRGLQAHQPPTTGRARTQQLLERAITQAGSGAAAGAPLGFRLLEHRADRGAGKDVVELLKQQRPPVGALLCDAAGLAAQAQQRQGQGQIRLPQQPLQAAVVALLIRAAGGAAAMELQVELITPHRQPRSERFEPIEIVPQRAVPLRAGQRLLLPELKLLQHLLGGATTVIAHTRQPEGLVEAGAGLPLQAEALHRQGVAVGADRRRHQRQQLGAAAAAPAEQTVREGIGGVPGQLVGAEPAHTRGLGHGRQPRREAEAVGQPAQLVAPFREGAAAVGLPQLELTQQRSGADQHAVALHPGPVDRLPATGLHGGADPGEQGGVMALDPGVEGWSGVGEVQQRMALQQGQR